jgi:division protein CdvB (Snf7/Vps24/ESCRT-III family)
MQNSTFRNETWIKKTENFSKFQGAQMKYLKYQEVYQIRQLKTKVDDMN